jgi:D-glycero-D-manno-heptose 1,7-bisphosphate phosphatase
MSGKTPHRSRAQAIVPIPWGLRHRPAAERDQDPPTTPMAKIPDKQGVFFELDGVLVERAQLAADGSIPFLPGALAALGRVDPDHFKLFVATSRQDIAFGDVKEKDFTRFCEAFLGRMHDERIAITKMYSCPYHPKGRGRFRRESVFRKPGPGIFKMAQQEFDLNLQRSWMIGHTTADVLAAQRAELGTILVRTGQAGQDGEFTVDAHFVEADFADAIARVNQFEFAQRC